ncbi:MAG: anti-sigma factor [Flavobacteriaceae bacterium]|nr:MAG: anti-sigma factor [Flavobacteriaceae bacterium]
MEQEKFKIWSIDYLSGALDAEGKKTFDAFLESNEVYKQEFKDLKNSWNQIENLETPVPSEEMDKNFYEMLYAHKEEKENVFSKIEGSLKTVWQSMMRPQLAYGILILCIGLGLGYFMNSEPTVSTTIVNTETEKIRGELVLTLLEQPSANKRLQGISEANKFTKANDKVIKALLQTLNNDPNVNVRLAAIEALTNYLDNPIVREGLVLSIVKQKSPIVQVTLADLMVALQEKKSIEPFKKLIRTKELDKSVKEKLETTIQSII